MAVHDGRGWVGLKWRSLLAALLIRATDVVSFDQLVYESRAGTGGGLRAGPTPCAATTFNHYLGIADPASRVISAQAARLPPTMEPLPRPAIDPLDHDAAMRRLDMVRVNLAAAITYAAERLRSHRVAPGFLLCEGRALTVLAEATADPDEATGYARRARELHGRTGYRLDDERIAALLRANRAGSSVRWSSWPSSQRDAKTAGTHSATVLSNTRTRRDRPPRRSRSRVTASAPAETSAGSTPGWPSGDQLRPAGAHSRGRDTPAPTGWPALGSRGGTGISSGTPGSSTSPLRCTPSCSRGEGILPMLGTMADGDCFEEQVTRARDDRLFVAVPIFLAAGTRGT